ncbi:hypothetical protein EJ04DRAFT_567665 [Polyplosphaeria fusca]|uniref:Uncharacterized protein n=1 Tax=Polyplosphaeria fusca TaxID=682080 RepID=A0A9P4QT70_9PLEO|nr:hypothetical protein EJ04DRAFT_567665 [Polyplosphaeria fusca]
MTEWDNPNHRGWAHVELIDPDSPRLPRHGFVKVDIPAELAGGKALVAAGKVVFEGIDLSCERQIGGGEYSGATAYDLSIQPFCATYFGSDKRFICKQRDTPLPVDRECQPYRPGHSTPQCYPAWGVGE